jgi:hypothetical protein
MFDSDGEQITFGPMGRKVWDMYAKIKDLVDREMMEFTIEELQTLKVIYGDNFFYPVYNHIDTLLDGAPTEETVH